MHKPEEKEADRDPQRQDRKPVLFYQRDPFVPSGEAFVLHEFTKKDVAPMEPSPKVIGSRISQIIRSSVLMITLPFLQR